MGWILIPTFILCGIIHFTADIPVNNNINPKK